MRIFLVLLAGALCPRRRGVGGRIAGPPRKTGGRAPATVLPV